MCGISGIFSLCKNTNDILTITESMNNSLSHRGPDSHGIWNEDDFSCVLAHRRLSIVDISPTGSQPMVSQSTRYVISYNGEVYNTEELKGILVKNNILMRGHSDTELILELCEILGVKKALKKLIGMFAFAIFDRKKKKLFLCRDRLGIKPLYWSILNEKEILFSSELKPFLSHPNFKKIINKNIISNYLRHGYIPAPYSIYKDVYKLEPGKILEISQENFIPKIFDFWNLQEIVRNRKKYSYNDKDFLIESLDKLLNDSVSKRMIADVPVGSFLSGGIDSTTVSAIMQKNSKKKINTFSIGFKESGYNEAVYAKKIANFLNTDHNELYLTSGEAQKFIPEIPKYFDEPFADSSQIPTYLISRMAVNKVKVALSGDGGDEVFMGYNRYTVAENMNWVLKLPNILKKFVIAIINLGSTTHWNLLSGIIPNKLLPSQLGDKLYKLVKVLKDKDPDFYRLIISSFDQPDSLVIGGSEYKGLIWKNNFDEFLTDYVEKLKLLDTLTYLPDDILTKVDRASMAVSLEVRVPILDHRIVEFSWMLPKEMQLKKNQSKWILRQVLKKYVPEELFNRPKMGFGVPIDSWLRKDLKNWASHLLSDEVFKKYELLKKDDIQLMWKQHQSNEKNWQHPLWNVLMLHSWAEAYI